MRYHLNGRLFGKYGNIMWSVLEKNSKSQPIAGYFENVCSHLHGSVSISVISSAVMKNVAYIYMLLWLS